MAICDVCGNDYDAAMTIEVSGGGSGTYDSFECAIHALAPPCDHCGCQIVGHGVESGDRLFCCAHCARNEGHTDLVDHAD
jgi:hypothetical protein